MRAIPCLFLSCCSAVTSASVFTSVAAAAPQQSDRDSRDAVVLKKGKPIRGRVLLELADKVSIRVGSKQRWIPRKKIDRVETVAASLRAILQAYAASREEPEGWMELAKECVKNKLPHEAQLFYWRTLLDHPKHAAANKALGHKRGSGNVWRLAIGRSQKTLEQAEVIHAKWNTALEMRSEHFQVRSDTGLRRTVFTLFELEFFYSHLMELFQQDLHLHEVTDPIKVHLYKDRKRFPNLSNTVAAYFSPDENILYTYLAVRGRPHALFHEATHAIVHNLGGAMRGIRTDIPGWLNEGWAEYMEGIMDPGKGGRVKVDVSGRVEHRLNTVRTLKKPYSLQRVMNFKNSDYSASTRQAEKYGQGYALFLFMLTGEGGKFLDRFLEYTRAAIDGKGSSSAFRKLFKKDMKQIEKLYLSVR